MLDALVYVTRFGDDGAFIEPSNGEDQPLQQQRLCAHEPTYEPAAGDNNNNSSSSNSSSTNLSTTSEQDELPVTTPSFESFLAVPRDFLAHHALERVVEATVLLDITSIAIEMDTITDCIREQLHDCERLRGSAMAAQEQSGASLMTALRVLMRHAAAHNTKTLTMLAQRIELCLDRLESMKFPLAHCIENNTVLATKEKNGQDGGRYHRLAQVEIELLRRISALIDPTSQLPMTPLRIPKQKPLNVEVQLSWLPSTSAVTTTDRRRSEGEGDDVHMSSSGTGSSGVFPSSSSSSISPSSPSARMALRASIEVAIPPGQLSGEVE